MVVQSLVQTRQELHQQVSTLFHQPGPKRLGSDSGSSRPFLALGALNIACLRGTNDPGPRIDERGQGQITFTEFEKLFADDGVTPTTSIYPDFSIF